MLRSGGALALHEVYAGPAGPRRYPVPWAADAEIDFLVSQEEARCTIQAVGLWEVQWVDVTEKSTECFGTCLPPGGPAHRPRWGFTCLSATFRRERANVLRNLEEGRITVAMGIFAKDEGDV